MKDLIFHITENSDLISKSIQFDELDFIFSSFADKDDFYLFLFCTYHELLSITEDPKDFEYSLNRIASGIQAKKLSEFKDRFLDRNMSFIIVLDCTSGNPNYTQLKKIEENYITAKKYLLAYAQEDFKDLMSEVKLLPGKDVVSKLNELSIEKSHLLTGNDQEAWYLLLMNLFVKLPFLNYQLLKENKQGLDNIDDLINANLTDSERNIFNLINEHYDENTQIEDFIKNYNLFDSGE